MDMQLFKIISGLKQVSSVGLPEWPDLFCLIHVPFWHSKDNPYLTVLECQGCLGFLFVLGLGFFGWLVASVLLLDFFFFFNKNRAPKGPLLLIRSHLILLRLLVLPKF